MYQKVINELRDTFHKLPDKRVGKNRQYNMDDIGMGAFSVFFMQSPSFLAHQKLLQNRTHDNNGARLFDIRKIPSDNHIRAMLDEVPPSSIFPLFDKLNEYCEQEKKLEDFRWQGRFLIALDGTEFFNSKNISCPNCLSRTSKKVTSFHHSAVVPVLVHPEKKFALPRAPEFIIQQNNHDKQDCESRASQRWIDRNKQWLRKNNAILLGDDLYSRSSYCKMLQQEKIDFIFVCKPTSHRYLTDWVNAFSEDDIGSYKVSQKKGGKKQVYNYRFANNVPLTADKDSPEVNWFEVIITDSKGIKLYKNSFVTSLKLNESNIHSCATAGKTRWKVENEAFNVLKNCGYHLEHNFGHGKKHLANSLMTLNLLAFLVHSIFELFESSYREIRMKLPTRKIFYQHIQALTSYFVFESWEHLFSVMMRGLERRFKLAQMESRPGLSSK